MCLLCLFAVLGQPVAVSRDELVAHLHDVVDRKLCRSVRLEHSRLIDLRAGSGDSRLDGQQLSVDVGHIHRREDGRELADMAGSDSAAVDKAGYLDAGVGGEIVNEPGVDNISADLVGLVGDDRFHDV